MDDQHTLDRRTFLRYSALAATTTLAAACGASNKSATQPTATSARTTAGPTKAAGTPPTSAAASPTSSPQATSGAASTVAPAPTGSVVYDVKYATGLTYKGTFHESPQLAAQVKAGKLPSVEKRLPENPYVVPHKWLTPGKYGGTIRMVISDTSDWATTHIVQEIMYGHSPVRWLQDALEIGPGLAESWEPNEDLSVWTFHFRKGLKWSDGAPWTVDDILFWYEDEVGVPALNQTPPQELRSGKGNPVKMKKVDDYTLELHFDSTTPLAADYAAAWVKRGQGPWWMDPKHYLKQFHIKYNKKLNPKTWAKTFNSKLDWPTNPDSPTMTGWMPQKYKKGEYSIWVRNPYYWCVDRWGNQLPFVDQVINTNIQDPQVMRLQIQQGKADYIHGAFLGMTLADVSTIKSQQSRNHLNILYWDSGTGTASAYYFNFDYHDPKYRKLFRTPKFRQALSLAYDRATARKTIYFNQGEATTGTMSPKAIEYHVGKGPQVYKTWRDSWVGYDPERAKKMLDELGIVDKNGDGWRDFPDGSPLKLTLDYTASDDPHGDAVQKNQLLAKNWQAIGINVQPNPVNGAAFLDLWAAGKLQNYADFGASDGPNCLVYPNWIVPMDSQRWAPMEGVGFYSLGTPVAKKELNVDPWKRHPPRIMPDEKEADPNVKKIWALYSTTRTEKSFMKRTQVAWEIMKVHWTAGPFYSGTVANYPELVLVRQGLKNVPTRDQLAQHGFVDPWVVPSPAVYDPEAYYWDNPEQHT